MRMDDEQESRNVEDRRAGSGRGGQMDMRTMMMLWPIIRPLLRSKFGLVIIGAGIAAYLMGYNPLALVGVKKVLKSTEDVWQQLLPQYGLRYKDPVMVLYRGYTQSGCGSAQSQMGPFYCPRDKKVYLDLGFFDELAKRHNAPGDFAQAYVLAHEIGHHVQDLQGILDKVQLQADCYAGIWGHYAQKKFHMLEPGDVEEALQAASSIGDDTLQRKATGHVRPDAFTHGSSKQRVTWFKRGFESGDLRQCNTFR